MSRHRQIRTSRHHRKCKSNGGTDDVRNISTVSRLHHKAFHILFANFDPHQIATILNNLWIDPDYELVVRRKVPYINHALHNW